MKRTVSILLIAACCLAFCSCGGSQEKSLAESQAEPALSESAPSKGDLLYEKYSSIIDALEEEDYQSAIAQINGLIPPPEYEEIVITADNFWDYFEYREEFERSIDSFGSVKTDYSRISSGFTLKEEYNNRLAAISSVAIAYYAEGIIEVAIIDEENHSFEWTGKTTDSPFYGDDTPEKERDVRLTFSPGSINTGTLIACLVQSNSVVYFRRLQNIQITRVEGTLYLSK